MRSFQNTCNLVKDTIFIVPINLRVLRCYEPAYGCLKCIRLRKRKASLRQVARLVISWSLYE